MRQPAGGVTIVAGHRVGALAEGRSRLTLTLEMRGPLVPVVGLFYEDLQRPPSRLSELACPRGLEPPTFRSAT